jgi:hypothetical protein
MHTRLLKTDKHELIKKRLQYIVSTTDTQSKAVGHGQARIKRPMTDIRRKVMSSHQHWKCPNNREIWLSDPNLRRLALKMSFPK